MLLGHERNYGLGMDALVIALMHDSLRFMGVPEDICTVILHLHETSHYQLKDIGLFGSLLQASNVHPKLASNTSPLRFSSVAEWLGGSGKGLRC